VRVPFFAHNRRRVQQSLDQSIDYVEQQVAADLEQRLRSEEASIRDALAAVEGASRAAEDDGGLADGAHISGELYSRGTSLRNDCGPALYANTLQVGQAMFLRSGFTATGGSENGAVCLLGAQSPVRE